ncbi:hypothetical protein [Anaerovorax sp. IOR16]|uniref:hypothetical protein n=1 Tax=Anaerovorax sp. IOR16 TaxID=2773458 RepID=UPI0019D0A756|nr:hypothetical protein [Anaerovorax sp. IOR16]
MRRWDLKLEQFSISKYRYRELHNFCRQYPEWRDELKYNTDALRGGSMDGMPRGGKKSDSTGNIAIRRAELQRKCEIIEQTAIEADAEIYQYLITNVTQDVGYYYLRDIMRMPAGKKKFYKARRNFFSLLDIKKDA